MILTKEEEAMARGQYGPGLEKCINLLIKFGEVFNAEKLVKVSSAHVYSAFPLDLLMELTEGANQSGAFTTIHPFMSLSDPLSWEKMGISKDHVTPLNREHEKKVEIYNRLSFFRTYTCVPMLVGNFVKKGDFISWFGSCPQLLANSIIGAKQNRDGAVVNMAIAITGKAPYWGLFLDENRSAEILVEVEDSDSELLTTTDYGAIGHYVGGIAKDRNIVINGLNRNITLDEMHYLLPPLSATGAVSLCHIVGVTPEAPDLITALGNKPPKETIHIGKEEISRAKEEYSTPESEEIDLVILGCPHCTIQELKQVAFLLENKKVGTNQRLWIGTAQQIYNLAQTMGYSQIIEKAGGLISRSCMSAVPDCPIPDDIRIIATNSFKTAHYISTFSKGRRRVVIGDLEDCINVAINGKWEVGD